MKLRALIVIIMIACVSVAAIPSCAKTADVTVEMERE